MLFIIVKDRPYIKSIKIYGDEKKKTLSLLNKYKIKVGTIYEHATLILCKNRIQDWHFGHGYLNTEVIIKLNKDVEKGKRAVNIKINVIKSNIFKIAHIELKGTKIYSKKKILSLFSHTSSKWMTFFTKSNIYIKSKMYRDIKKIKSFYMNRGFLDFYIKYIKITKKKMKKI
ncbi:MAG TPA: POTRA domain-containing protein [Candidatus Azoamicus sp.]